MRELPFQFIVDELTDSRIGGQIKIRPMFGCHAVYIGEKIVFIVRLRLDGKTERDNGTWVVVNPDHRDSVMREFPELRPIEIFQKRFAKAEPSWMNLSHKLENFEEKALELCAYAIRADERFGKIPKSKQPRKIKKVSAQKTMKKSARKAVLKKKSL